MKLSEAYDKIVANKNIPKEITAPVFKIMNDCSRGKYTEQQAIKKVKRLMNANKIVRVLESHNSLTGLIINKLNI